MTTIPCGAGTSPPAGKASKLTRHRPTDHQPVAATKAKTALYPSADSRLGHCKAGAATESCSAAAAPSGSSPWLAATSAKADSATGESQRRQSIPGNCVWYVFVSRYTPLQPRSSKSAQDTYLQTYRQTRIHTYTCIHTYTPLRTCIHTQPFSQHMIPPGTGVGGAKNNYTRCMASKSITTRAEGLKFP